jgi:hypothetical protein
MPIQCISAHGNPPAMVGAGFLVVLADQGL